MLVILLAVGECFCSPRSFPRVHTVVPKQPRGSRGSVRAGAHPAALFVRGGGVPRLNFDAIADSVAAMGPAAPLGTRIPKPLKSPYLFSSFPLV